MTVQDLIYDVRALLNEYTDDGVIIAEEDIIDIQEKAIRFVNMGQRQLYKLGNKYETHPISHTPIDNLCSVGFGIEEFTGETIYLPSETGVQGAQSYYIEADNPLVIELQENQSGVWTTLETETATLIGYTAFKGNLTLADTSNYVRYKISGSTFARVRNVALFEYLFNVVPNYAPYYKEEMPSDFRSVDAVVEEYPNQNYRIKGNYKLEKNNTMYIDWNFSGQMRVNYFAYPTDVALLTDSIDLDDIATNALTYYVAAKIAAHEFKQLVNLFEDLYQEAKQILVYEPASSVEMLDYYGEGV